MRWPGRNVWLTCGSGNRVLQHLVRRRAAAGSAGLRDSGHAECLPRSSADSRRASDDPASSAGPHVDDLHHPIRIGAAGGCEQIRNRLARDAHRLLQRLGLIHQHVRTRGRVALIVDQPLAPAWTSASSTGKVGRDRYGTGFAGSETYSSYFACVVRRRLSKPSRPPASKYSERGFSAAASAAQTRGQ